MKYRLMIYDTHDRNSSNALGTFESTSPFMAISAGDYLDPRMMELLGMGANVRYHVVELEHEFSSESHWIRLYIDGELQD